MRESMAILPKINEGYIRGAIVGMLAVFIIAIVKELNYRPLLLLLAVILSFVAILLAKKASRHFHGSHTHSGDSAIDVVAPSMLFLVNILHPAIDGFSLYETFDSEGALAGFVLFGGVILHEAFRQSAIITAFKSFSIKWYWVVATALFGILLGVATGIAGSEFFHRHEGVIEIATLFAYVFIIAEFYYADRSTVKKSWAFVALGVVIGSLLSVFFGAH